MRFRHAPHRAGRVAAPAVLALSATLALGACGTSTGNTNVQTTGRADLVLSGAVIGSVASSTQDVHCQITSKSYSVAVTGVVNRSSVLLAIDVVPFTRPGTFSVTSPTSAAKFDLEIGATAYGAAPPTGSVVINSDRRTGSISASLTPVAPPGTAAIQVHGSSSCS